MKYQTLEEAIQNENVNSREELVELLRSKYALHKNSTDLELLEKINQYCSEHIWHPDREIANDPIDW
jgi:transcription elongation factor GreA-like protein